MFFGPLLLIIISSIRKPILVCLSSHDPFMSFFRLDLCLFSYSGVQHILCCVFAVFFFVLCTLCRQFPWIVHFWFPLSVFSSIYLFLAHLNKILRHRLSLLSSCFYILISLLWNNLGNWKQTWKECLLYGLWKWCQKGKMGNNKLLVIFLMNSLWKSWAKEGGISKVELFHSILMQFFVRLTCFSLLVAGVWFSLGIPLISAQYTVKPVLWNLPREHWERVTLDRVCLIWVDDYAWHTIQREIILRSYNTSYFLIEVAAKAGLTVTPMLLKVTLWKIVKWSSYVGFSMDTEVGLWCLFVWLPLTEQ